jgi:hypothetical protein
VVTVVKPKAKTTIVAEVAKAVKIRPIKQVRAD